MVQTYQPRIMDINEDTIPELQPIFSYLNNHSNKLYHEGYFLKLDDQNSRMSARRFRHPCLPLHPPLCPRPGVHPTLTMCDAC